MKHMDKKGNIKSFYETEANMISSGNINIEISDLIEQDNQDYKKHIITRAKHSLGMNLAEKAVRNIEESYDYENKRTQYRMSALVLDEELAFKLFKNIKEVSDKDLSQWASDLIDYILSDMRGEQDESM